jgi:putative transcriptional regulator
MARLAWCLCLAAALALPLRAQEESDGDPATGKLLVATDTLKEAPFAQSVILLIHYADDGVVGVILNQPTKMPLSEVFPGKTKGKNRADPAYRGGPVEETGVLALLRSAAAPEEAANVLEDVYAATGERLLSESVSAEKGPEVFRVYLGYCGWAPDQLEMEIEAGAWRVIDGTADLVFDREPATLWRRLFQKINLRMAHREALNPALRFVPAYLGRFETEIEKNPPAVLPVRQAFSGVRKVRRGDAEAGLPERL